VNVVETMRRAAGASEAASGLPNTPRQGVICERPSPAPEAGSHAVSARLVVMRSGAARDLPQYEFPYLTLYNQLDIFHLRRNDRELKVHTTEEKRRHDP
jgi:hypothetical protein